LKSMRKLQVAGACPQTSKVYGFENTLFQKMKILVDAALLAFQMLAAPIEPFLFSKVDGGFHGDQACHR
jgi:hypothetical protein